MSVLYNYKGMQSVVPETRRALPALPFWVGPGGKQSKKGRVNRVIPVIIIIVSSHVAFAVKGFIASEVITRRFLERDMSDRVGSRRSGSWCRSRSRGRSRFIGGSGFAADGEVGRVPTSEVGLALVDLDTREVPMVLGEMHSVT